MDVSFGKSEKKFLRIQQGKNIFFPLTITAQNCSADS